MAKDLNRWTGIGNLGRDPEMRRFPNGDAACNFRIACGDDYKNKDGDYVERTEWVNLSAYGKLAEIAGKYLRKGSRIYAEGKLTTRKWEDNTGTTRYSTEIRVESFQMLDGKTGTRAADKPEEPPFEDSDIPF